MRIELLRWLWNLIIVLGVLLTRVARTFPQKLWPKRSRQDAPTPPGASDESLAEK